MSENGGGSMQALRREVAGCPSGARLAAALESASLANSDIPGLIAAVIGEKLAAGGTTGIAKAAAQADSAPAAAAAAGAAPAERLSLNGALCVADGLSFLHPRGKQQLALFSDKLVVRTAKADIAVPWPAIKHVAIIDSIPGDTKGKVLLYMHIDSEHTKVMNGKTQLAAVVIQTTADAQLDVPHPQGGGRLQGPAPVVLAVPNGVDPTCFVSPDAAAFQSADKAAGVRAHVKAKEGFLYPLPSALCFLDSPATFLPHSAIRSVELLRAGGGSSTFDVVLHLKSGKQQEFTFIARQEVAALEDYLRKSRLPLGAAASSDEEEEGEGEGEGQGGEVEAQDEDSDDPEDEDFNPSSSSDDEEEEGGEGGSQQQSGGSKRGRGGAAEAGAGEEGAGEEEEEEEEEEEAEDSSSEEDDSDDEGSVELVSEDNPTVDESVLGKEESSERRPKRRRT